LPAGVSVLAIFALALMLHWQDPGERVVTQRINEVASQGLNTVMLFWTDPMLRMWK